MMKLPRVFGFVTVALFLSSLSTAGLAASNGIEVFGKGSLSKSNLSSDKHIISLSAAGGLAFTLFSNIRIEGRYSNLSSLQNKFEIGYPSVVASLTDMKTQTSIYSLGMDISILGDKSAFQPFIYVGAGFIETERSYYFSSAGSEVQYIREPKRTGITGNAGLGFRLMMARALAFEAEVFAYATDVHLPNSLIDWTSTVGIRFYL